MQRSNALQASAPAEIHPVWCRCADCNYLYTSSTRSPPFYDPATRTFRPFGRQAILTLAAAPVIAGMVAFAMAVL